MAHSKEPKAKRSKSEDKKKKSKKRKLDETAEDHPVSAAEPPSTAELAPTAEAPPAAENVAEEGSPEAPKRKKRRKQRKNVEDGSPEVAKANDAPQRDQEGETGLEAKPEHRFIVFVGNLPYSVTKEGLAKHFKKVSPNSIRPITDKKTGKSKGFAFLEFDRFDHMKSCLSLYHHTHYDDGAGGTRKINVELTAGGGGSKSETRNSRIKSKNEKLVEERRRKKHEEKMELQKNGARKSKEEKGSKEEKKSKGEKRSKGEKKAKGEKKSKEDKPAPSSEEQEPNQQGPTADGHEDHHGMHPSRRARMLR
ncbi:hypothetical protein BDY21DRAFT_311923 [Lineolata rhizophorae]|uniref:RRM domain-containing protein n=1 Tax=Lineolata rhizophorae TaxID=578093 RepID=A0A6A6NLM5_9PEZI|nr:hypothetical protein BDY21DRAFT_311923 [Lineolata rhizophorae]